MIKELFQKKMCETSLNVTTGIIDSIRTKNITKSGCRVYKDGYIGIAGTLGDPTDATWEEAILNLSSKVPYPYEPEKNKERVRDLRKETRTTIQLITEFEDCLHILTEKFPMYLLSNKINLVELETSLSNDAGLNYKNISFHLFIDLIVKHVDSVNIFDTAISYRSDFFDKEKFLAHSCNVLSAYESKAELPESRSPILILEQYNLTPKLIEELSSKKIGHNISLLNDSMHKKVFHEDFSFGHDVSDKNTIAIFFDHEGVTIENDYFPLIEHGVIEHSYTDKQNANKFNLPLTGNASGAYDETPSLEADDLIVKSGDKTLKELLHDELGIYVLFSSGGDFTSEGFFGAPVQNAYLTDGERLLGVLPEFSMSGSMFDIFGSNFIGVTKDIPFGTDHLIVTKMNVTKE